MPKTGGDIANRPPGSAEVMCAMIIPAVASVGIKAHAPGYPYSGRPTTTTPTRTTADENHTMRRSRVDPRAGFTTASMAPMPSS